MLFALERMQRSLLYLQAMTPRADRSHAYASGRT